MLKYSHFIVPTLRFSGDGLTVDTVKSWVETNKENPDVQSFVKTLNPINEDVVKGFLENDEKGKGLASKLFDQKVSVSVKTFEKNFKEKTLPTLIEEEYKKKHPEETPEQKANRDLLEKVTKLENENKFSKLKEKALELITEAKLPFTKIVDKFIAEDEETTVSKIQAFKEIWDDEIKKEVDKRLAENSGRAPNDRQTDVNTLQKQYDEAKAKGNLNDMVRLKNEMLRVQLEKASKTN